MTVCTLYRCFVTTTSGNNPGTLKYESGPRLMPDNVPGVIVLSAPVECSCGRAYTGRWFEVDVPETNKCPRCGKGTRGTWKGWKFQSRVIVADTSP